MLRWGSWSWWESGGAKREAEVWEVGSRQPGFQQQHTGCYSVPSIIRQDNMYNFSAFKYCHRLSLISLSPITFACRARHRECYINRQIQRAKNYQGNLGESLKRRRYAISLIFGECDM